MLDTAEQATKKGVADVSVGEANAAEIQAQYDHVLDVEASTILSQIMGCANDSTGRPRERLKKILELLHGLIGDDDEDSESEYETEVNLKPTVSSNVRGV
jgi:hypothetical protein